MTNHQERLAELLQVRLDDMEDSLNLAAAILDSDVIREIRSETWEECDERHHEERRDPYGPGVTNPYWKPT